MAETYAKVNRPNYLFRGHNIRKGTTVKVTEAQLEAAKRKDPPYLVKSAAPKKGESFVDLTGGAKMPQAELPTAEKK